MADDHVRCTYNDVHKLIAKASERIQEEFKPDVIIAIGGGFVPLDLTRQVENPLTCLFIQRFLSCKSYGW
jgi:hypothetical protein